MNNRGFTLIELLLTIALLAVISVISFVSINRVTEQSKVNNCEDLVRNIESATKMYVSDNRYKASFDTNNDKKENISASDLVSGNYLNGIITDPFTKNTIVPSDIKIEIELNDDYTTKVVVIKNKSDNVIDCSSNKW